MGEGFTCVCLLSRYNGSITTEVSIKQAIDIEKLRAFETAEVRRFARCVAEWVYNFLLSYVQNEQDAEELVQDTLLGALDGVRQFRGESSLKTWVYRIAMNKVRDHIKSRSRLKRSMQIASLEGEEPGDFRHPGIVLESKEAMQSLFRAINRLPENQKTALILAKIDHESHADIADYMGTTSKAVESLVARAKSNLSKILAGQEPDVLPK